MIQSTPFFFAGGPITFIGNVTIGGGGGDPLVVLPLGLILFDGLFPSDATTSFGDGILNFTFLATGNYIIAAIFDVHGNDPPFPIGFFTGPTTDVAQIVRAAVREPARARCC